MGKKRVGNNWVKQSGPGLRIALGRGARIIEAEPEKRRPLIRKRRKIKKEVPQLESIPLLVLGTLESTQWLNAPRCMGPMIRAERKSDRLSPPEDYDRLSRSFSTLGPWGVSA